MVTCFLKQRLLHEQPQHREVLRKRGPCAGKGGNPAPRGLSLGPPDALVPPMPSPRPRPRPGAPGRPQEPKAGSCLLGHRPHLDLIPSIQLMAASQTPAPLIPPALCVLLTRTVICSLKMGRLPKRPLGCCLPWGPRGRGGRRPGTGEGEPLQSRAPHFGHLLPNSPGDSEGDAWGPLGTGHQERLPAPSCAVTGLCGRPIDADNSLWHRVPEQTPAHQRHLLS